MPMRKEKRRRTSRTPAQHPWSSCHHCIMVSLVPRNSRYLNVPKFEVLASLQRQLCLRLARCALQSQHDLLRCLGLLVENRLRLTTITGLFAIISTLSLGEQGCLEGVRMVLSLHGLQHAVPFQPCIASLCAGCASCSPCPCSRCVWSWVR